MHHFGQNERAEATSVMQRLRRGLDEKHQVALKAVGDQLDECRAQQSMLEARVSELGAELSTLREKDRQRLELQSAAVAAACEKKNEEFAMQSAVLTSSHRDEVARLQAEALQRSIAATAQKTVRMANVSSRVNVR